MKTILIASLLTVIIAGATELQSQTPVRRILLEEFSTAPCGFCPDGDLIAAQIVRNKPRVLWVTHHAGFGTDSMTAPESITIANAFTTFAPGAAIDRRDYQIPTYSIPPYIAVSRQKWDSLCTEYIDDPAIVHVNISTSYDESKRVLNCSVGTRFWSLPDSGDIRVNAFVVEDSVIGYGKGYDQKNYYNTTKGHPYYQKGDSIYGYVHHRVVRKALGGAWGLKLATASIDVGVDYTNALPSFTIPATWNAANLDVVAFTSYHHTDAAKRRVMNAQSKRMMNIATDVHEAGIELNNTLYPNPADEFVNLPVANSSDSEVLIQFSRLDGTSIYSVVCAPGTQRVSVTNIPTGVYGYILYSAGIACSRGLMVVAR